ncbi:MAG: ATP-binding cassette domain-containing protein [Ruminococcaceae bacterium]|nr:ATP-binding cassette domain-containing protein [Oscillospiraceae bacterium]
MIKVENLVKKYGNKYAVNDVSFTVGDREIVGFLGPNGAGKSTTMNILTGYLSSTSGTCEIDGHDILEDSNKAKSSVGYLPEIPPLYMDMTVKEYLNFVYDLKGCKLNRVKHIQEILNVVKIEDVYNRLIRNLSRGYRQRVGIAQALIGNPKVIILDEPTIGLDPKQIVEVRNLIRTLGRDHSVILSTHILSEVQAVCDRIVIINKGRVVADKPTDEIGEIYTGTRRLEAKICGNSKEVLNALRSLQGITRADALAEHDLDATTFVIESAPGVDIRKPLFNMLASKNMPLVGLTSLGMNLEDIFISLTNDPTKAPAKKSSGSKGSKGSNAKKTLGYSVKEKND